MSLSFKAMLGALHPPIPNDLPASAKEERRRQPVLNRAGAFVPVGLAMRSAMVADPMRSPPMPRLTLSDIKDR